jgi:Lar family restriction alleviation protein
MSDGDMVELKPCPFCGGKASIFEVLGQRRPAYYAVCNDEECGAEVCGQLVREDAAKLWNRRAALNTGETE